MSELFNKIVNKLIIDKDSIATMESCTGGALANAFTMIPGVSEVFHFGTVTYSNDYKIKMGVSKEIIDKYTVYSKETAEEMARVIADVTSSTYGIGVTGKLNAKDPANLNGDDRAVYFSIYNRHNNRCHTIKMQVEKQERESNKNDIINRIALEFVKILNI